MSTTQELPSQQTIADAKEALRRLTPLGRRLRRSAHVRLAPEGSGSEGAVSVPRQAFELFLEILGQLANGNAVTIVPIQAELTTQQAADLLNVSRPHLVSLLEKGELQFRRVGSHRRVAAKDLFEYKRRDLERREQSMAELAAEAQRLGLGY